jgi:hypothetical protein
MPEGLPPSSRAPSDPKPLPSRGGADWARPAGGYGSPARLQMLAVVLLGLLLVAVPLYLWRRPRSAVESVAADASALDGNGSETPGTSPEDFDAPPPSGLRLTDARVLECHDQGSKKTPTEQCDPLPVFAKTFSDAILGAKDCMPASAGPGSITYVADVSFSRHRPPVTVSLPKDGRSYKGLKVVAPCAAAVRASMSGVSLEAMPHVHARYKFAVIATYPAHDAPGN